MTESTPHNPSARRCAVELLSSVLDERRPLDEAFSRHVGVNVLPERDRAFARLMVMTALRHLLLIDALLKTMLEKPLTGRTHHVLNCLRLGAVQLLYLRTPPHAAVHTMVETTAEMGHERMKGVVNAVLKRVAREGQAFLDTRDETATIPAWLFNGWKQTYGEEIARAIALGRLAEPPLDISVKEDAEGWAEKLGGALLPTGAIRIARAGRVDALPGYAEGAWWVQDAAASLPMKLLGDVNGKRVLDCCAAPGGKTAQLAAAGAYVTALDKSARRLKLLTDNLARLKLSAETVEADALRYTPDKLFDAVLLDAPCSATGTLRRHPEVVLQKHAGDIAELGIVQKRLLARAAQWVVPGGRLLYCVCSLQPEEGEIQAEAFTAAHPEYTVVSPPPEWPALGLTDKIGALRTHPGGLAAFGGMDGFYAICWQRLKEF